MDERAEISIGVSSSGPRLGRRLVFCFVLLPALLALFNVIRVSPLTQSMSFFDRVLFHLPPALLAWSISGIVIAGIVNITRARSWTALIFCYIAGGIISAVFNYYVVSSYFFFMRSHWPWITEFYNGGTPILKQNLLEFLINPVAMYTYLTLLLANLGYRLAVRGSRFLGDAGADREEPAYPVAAGEIRPESRTEDARTPNFMKGLVSRLGSDLILLEAQEHYIKVVTPEGSALVLYRLSNALEELFNHDGDRVHRSFWIAWPHVREIKRDGRSYRLCMSNGMEVPVSRSHLGVVERHMTH